LFCVSEKLKGNHFRSSTTTNIPLPLASNNKSVSPTTIHTTCNFGRNPGHLTVVDVKPKHLPNFSNVDVEKSRPHSLGVENTSVDRSQIVKYSEQKRHSCLEPNSSSSYNELGSKIRFQNNKGRNSNKTISAMCSPVQRNSGRSSSSSPVSSSNDPSKKVHDTKTTYYKRVEAVNEHGTSKSDNVVKGTSSDNAPSTIDKKTFKTSSSDSESFNATEYKGERTYF
jgi:hypothetical protein